jgi:hypothetical protein
MTLLLPPMKVFCFENQANFRAVSQRLKPTTPPQFHATEKLVDT